MKCFLALIVVCVPVWAHALCIPAENYTQLWQRYESGLLLAAKDCSGDSEKTHYVFGTLHSDAPAIKARAKNALAAIQQTDVAAFELVLDSSAQTQSLQAMTYPYGETTLDKHITPELYNALRALNARENRIPEQLLPLLQPWAAAVLLQYPPSIDDGVVLDSALQNFAEKQEKRIVGLETIAEQFRTFKTLPDADAIAMLEQSVYEFDQLAEAEKKLMTLYQQDNLAAIQAYSEELFAQMPSIELANHLRNELIISRNQRIAERARTIMKQSTLFVAVGALHLPGKNGIVTLLEQQGFQFTVAQ